MAIELPTIVTFIGYLLVTLAIGFVAFKATDTLSDYILGGRQLGPGVTALSVGASDMSGWLLLGLPGAIYLSGVSEVWIGVGLVIGAILIGYSLHLVCENLLKMQMTLSHYLSFSKIDLTINLMYSVLYLQLPFLSFSPFMSLLDWLVEQFYLKKCSV